VVGAWLLGIIVNLLIIPAYFDVALRDVGLAPGALALARLSEDYGGRRARRVRVQLEATRRPCCIT
jgi:hypothetical protein